MISSEFVIYYLDANCIFSTNSTKITVEKSYLVDNGKP